MKRLQIISGILLTLSLLACSSNEIISDSVLSDESVTIAYAEPITDYSPLSYTAKDRRYLANIYESLVHYDSSFNTATGLAVAWGREDDRTWEFRLREGVVFHDGTSFDAQDALYSLNLAMSDPESELGALLSVIESTEVTEEGRLKIKTFEPDPLLLNRLVNVYMIPDSYEDFLTPNGTGAYTVSGFEDNALILKRFDYYWGDAPYFAEARLKYEPQVQDRFEGLKSGEIQVLANVPPQYTTDLIESAISIDTYPSLESSFLIFNDSAVFEDPELRKAAWSSLDVSYATTLGGGFLTPTSQYAASGIMGYVSTWETEEKELIKLDELIEVTLDIPEGISVLGLMIVEDMHEAGFDVTLNELSLEEFEAKIYSGESDLFFFGWKYDLADVSEFFEAVIHSEGDFNATGYKNPELDVLIELAAQSLELEERRSLLEQIARQYYDDQVAFPLFESKVLYGVHPSVTWEARLDGLILASEISGNVVE